MLTWRNLMTVSGILILWGMSILLALILTSIVGAVGFVPPIIIAAWASLLIAHERFELVPRRRDAAPTPAAQGLAEKRKRHAESETEVKMRLLLDLMDDDEREMFKNALANQLLDRHHRLSDDGELSADARTLSELMDERSSYS